MSQRELEGKTFFWSENNDWRIQDFYDNPNARCLPGNPHGLNGFLEYHNAALLTARNPPPDLAAFYEHLGLTREEIVTATHRFAIYQAAMRCSLRKHDPEDTDGKTIIVPDRETAEWLSLLFPGSMVIRVDADLSGIERPRKRGRPPKNGVEARTGAERMRACRERKKKEAQKDPISLCSLPSRS